LIWNPFGDDLRSDLFPSPFGGDEAPRPEPLPAVAEEELELDEAEPLA